MTAQTVLEELTQYGLTQEHVERRVEEWNRRIGALYADIDPLAPGASDGPAWCATHHARRTDAQYRRAAA